MRFKIGLVYLTLFYATSVFPNNPHCDLSPGTIDAYVLALSWQSGFCETYGYKSHKPECQSDPGGHAAYHLVLHGLWPNQSECGLQYNFCKSVSKAHFCDYEPVTLDFMAMLALTTWMPSYTYGSCLERHEWNKHGTCQLLSSSDYFLLATHLTEEADNQINLFLINHLGQWVSRENLITYIAQQLDLKNKRLIYLGCKDNILVDIYISLPAEISNDKSLLELLKNSTVMQSNSRCGSEIKISNFLNFKH